VGVLGPDDFLAPVCMLLVDKVAMRVTRQNAEEAQRTLELAISVVQHHPTSLQIQVSQTSASFLLVV
jgi:U3 small nucleolar RNA-associated protein 10